MALYFIDPRSQSQPTLLFSERKERRALNRAIDLTDGEVARLYEGLRSVFTRERIRQIERATERRQAILIHDLLGIGLNDRFQIERSIVLQSINDVFRSSFRQHTPPGFNILSNADRHVQRGISPYLGARYPRPVVDTTNEILRQIRTKGLTPMQAIDQFTQRHADLAQFRAARIIRTEATRVHALGAHTAIHDAEELGGTVIKTWITGGDARVRSTHAELENAQTAGSDGVFTTSQGAARYPGDFDIPAEDINCRCIISYEFIDTR